jgi:hypothetical protein
MSNQVPRYVFLHLLFISLSYHVYFHFTLHMTLYLLPPVTNYEFFYYVLNISSQALVAVSSSGHIRIAPHTLTSH